MSAWKSGMSSFKNLGMLASFIARIRTISSEMEVSALLSEPAITKRDLTALIPKS